MNVLMAVNAAKKKPLFYKTPRALTGSLTQEVSL